MNPRVAAVVVTRDRLALLEQCVAHILAQEGASCDILIVDNASTDGTDEAVVKIRAESPRVRYRNTGENLGGAGGFAYGCRWAVEDGYTHIWLMDDDTLPTEGALAALLAAGDALGAYGWLSSTALWTDGAPCPMNVQRKSPYSDIAADLLLGEDTIHAKMASFVSLLLPVETVRAHGLPIGEFFIWGDDWEYTRRVSLKESCYVVPSSRVVHAMGSKTVVNIATDSEARLPRYAYAYRNDVVLYRREGLRGWLWLLAKDAWHSAQVIVKSPSGRGKRLGIIWRGFARGCRFRPEVEHA